jgi:hypothetical protein
MLFHNTFCLQKSFNQVLELHKYNLQHLSIYITINNFVSFHNYILMVFPWFLFLNWLSITRCLQLDVGLYVIWHCEREHTRQLTDTSDSFVHSFQVVYTETHKVEYEKISFTVKISLGHSASNQQINVASLSQNLVPLVGLYVKFLTK